MGDHQEHFRDRVPPKLVCFVRERDPLKWVFVGRNKELFLHCRVRRRVEWRRWCGKSGEGRILAERITTQREGPTRNDVNATFQCSAKLAGCIPHRPNTQLLSRSRDERFARFRIPGPRKTTRVPDNARRPPSPDAQRLGNTAETSRRRDVQERSSRECKHTRLEERKLCWRRSIATTGVDSAT